MTEPLADRPFIPAYGEVPESTDGMVTWAWARERLERAITYWLATSGADGSPHIVAIWGVWVGGCCFVEGKPGATRWQRNLGENPKAAIKIESDDEVIIVEGFVVEHVAPPSPLANAILAGFAKYRAKGYEASAERWAEGGLWELRPVKAFAWSVYPEDMARFRFSAT